MAKIFKDKGENDFPAEQAAAMRVDDDDRATLALRLNTRLQKHYV